MVDTLTESSYELGAKRKPSNSEIEEYMKKHVILNLCTLLSHPVNEKVLPDAVRDFFKEPLAIQDKDTFSHITDYHIQHFLEHCIPKGVAPLLTDAGKDYHNDLDELRNSRHPVFNKFPAISKILGR